MNNIKWQMFYLKDLFEVSKGTRLTIENRIKGNIPFATAGHNNQGISSFIGNNDLKIYKDVITIDMFSEAFYRDYYFCCDDNVHVLIPKVNINKYIALFIVAVINSSKDILNFGKQYRLKTFERHQILMPIDDKGNINYNFMEQYMKNLEETQLNKYKKVLKNKIKKLKYKKIEKLNEKEWNNFFLEELGSINSGKDITKAQMKLGNIPYITATSTNNGVNDFVSNTNNTLDSNCISINRTGSVGCSFYHPYIALFSNNCRKFKLKIKNKYVALFIVNQISQQKEKYSYGYIMGTERIKRQKILLPVDKNGKPDYPYMEQYMKNLDIKLLEKYSNYLNTK